MLGAKAVAARRDDPEYVLSMLNPNRDPAKIMKAYEQLTQRQSAKLGGEMCWPVDWYPEHLPIENATGSAMHFYLQHVADPLSCVDGGQWPPVDYAEVQKEDILVFSDSYGFCKEILEQAPPGRISIQNVQTKAAASYDEKTLKTLVTMHPWDLILFAVGVDPPASNSVADVHKQQDAVLKMLLTILKTLGEDTRSCKRLCVLTTDVFSMEKEVHEECGVGLTTNSCLFGMVNTARQEVPLVGGIQYIDTEWALRTENTKYLAAEIFRHQSFGQNNVRILNRGRYVMRKVASKPLELKGDFQLPDDGVIAISGGNGALGLVMGAWLLRKAKEQGNKRFSMKFLSRTMKVNEQNMPNWLEIQKLAGELGIEVEQAKCDVSKQDSVDDFIQGVTPNLTGFIHSAGILQDAMLQNQTWDKFESVFEAKSRAALFLHDALERFQNPRLEFFWLFSSGAVYGNMGQLNYSASNAYLDGLARHRRALGKPCMAPQWGAWGDVGMAANLDDASRKRMANSPMPYFSNAEGLYGLECGLRTGWPYFEVHKVKPDFYFQMVTYGDDDNPSFQHLKNTSCAIFPSPPAGDAAKNPYSTYTYTMRKQVLSHQGEGLFLQAAHPKVADRWLYEQE